MASKTATKPFEKYAKLNKIVPKHKTYPTPVHVKKCMKNSVGFTNLHASGATKPDSPGSYH